MNNGKRYKMTELFIASGVPVEQSVYPNLLSGDQLTDLDGTISEIRIGAGQYSAPLNGVIATALHELLVNQNVQIDTFSSADSELIAVKIRIGGCVSVATTDSSGTLSVCGPAMRLRSFNTNMARAIVAFFLANKSLYPGVAAELPGLVSAYSSNADKERYLCRFSDAVSFYLERILSESEPNIRSLCTSTELPALLDYTLLYSTISLQDCFHDPEAIEMFPNLVLENNDNPPPVGVSSGKYIGPLKQKLTRYLAGAKHTLISGPTATGKTLCVEEVCQVMDAPLTVMKGAEHLEDIDMIGGINPVGERMSMVYGPLTRALKLGRTQYMLQMVENEKANGVFEPVKIPPAVLFIDEINRLQPKYLNMLITAMNVSKETNEHQIEIPCNGEVVTCPSGYFMLISAQNNGQLHTTYDLDLALLRRFHSKVSVDYLPYDKELKLIQDRNPTLNPDIVTVICKVAQDTRYQLSGLRAPIDTDTLQKWAAEITELLQSGQPLSVDLLHNAAEDIVYAVCLERSLIAAYDPSGVAILTDNITENYKNTVKGE